MATNKAPSKPGKTIEPKPNKRTRGPSRVIRIEADPHVIEWCRQFKDQTEDEMGFRPTDAQAFGAWFRQAKVRMMGGVAVATPGTVPE